MAIVPICQKKAARCLKVPLTPVEQIYLMFIIPAFFCCIVYMTNLAVDVTMAIAHYRDGNPVWGMSTLALMYAPAFVYFALTVSRPDWWMTEDEKLKDGVVVWFAMQIFRLLAFPLFTLYRLGSLIVLTTDSLRLHGAEREETLKLAAAPAAMELYFFVHAWFQAAPQAVFQTHLLFREYKQERTYQTVVVHVICIVTSVVVVSLKAASFQRFESQRINGRRLPWATWLEKSRKEESGNREEKKPLQVEGSGMIGMSVTPLVEEEDSPPKEGGGAVDAEASSRQHLERQISMTPPLPPKNLQVNPPPAPIRGLTSVASLPVPEMPAPPRPDSMLREPEVTSSERRVNIGEASSTEKMDDGKSRDLRIPQRKYSVKGLDEDDAVGSVVSLLWWFCFILARVFAIAMFYEFYPMWLIGLIALHYSLMISYIFYNAKYYDVTSIFLTLWLGFVYIFCAIEYRVKFNSADISLLAYYTLVIVQNTIMTVTWFVLAEWSGFWYTYIFFAILISMASCLMCGGVYVLLLKPKKRRVYAN